MNPRRSFLGIVLCLLVLAVPCWVSVGQTATPSVEITFVPPFGATGDVKGRVLNTQPTDYRIAFFYFISGVGWFSRPSCELVGNLEVARLVPIQADGTWAATLGDDSRDRTASKVAAFLVPSNFTQACVLAGDRFPRETERQMLARHITPRPNQPELRFSDYDWIVKTNPTLRVGPDSNFFSDSKDNVWVDDRNRLHLQLTQRDGIWYCSEIISKRTFGYGTYRFFLDTAVDNLDPNAVLGLFVWSDDPAFAHREVDIEFSRWGNPIDPDFAQFVVAPFNLPDHRHRFRIPQGITTSVVSFTWEPDRIYFRVATDQSGENPLGREVLQEWSFTDPRSIPPSGDENVRINLWLVRSRPPVSNRPVEVVIRRFEFTPSGPIITPDGVVNSASHLTGPVTPFEIVSIFGRNIGPETPAQSRNTSNGILDTTLAGTRVWFDDTPGVLLFAGKEQINVIVPSNVAGKRIVSITVEYLGQRSNMVSLGVAVAAPAIFTVTGNGRGQAAVVNQDGTINSPSNPAPAGSIISVYLTGAGQTNPPSVDGRIGDENPSRVALPVAASVGGITAQVVDAVAAPGLVAGAVQVNLRVPSGLPLASAHPLALTVGNAQTQPGVTVAIGLTRSLICINSVTPANGPTGTRVTIDGCDFRDGMSVLFGTTPATGIVITSANTISAIAPQRAVAEVVDVTVVSPDGQRATLPRGFRYESPLSPAIENIRVEQCATSRTPGRVSGRVVNAENLNDLRIAVFARTDKFYAQPCTFDKVHRIRPDGTWGPIESHGGTIYVYLVRPTYVPPNTSFTPPDPDGNDILAASGAVGSVPQTCDVPACPAQ